MIATRLTLAYFLIALIASYLLHGSIDVFGSKVAFILSIIPGPWRIIGLAASVVGGLVALAHLVPATKAPLVRGACALGLVVMFQASFMTLKTAMPQLADFHADRLLADADRWLHGGIDPWQLTLPIAELLHMSWFDTIYGSLWALLALFLPVIIATFDPEPERRNRFFLLYRRQV